MAEKAWADMTPDEKRAWRIERWRNPDIEFVSPEAEAEYKARVDRFVAAFDLREPDRVPVNLNAGLWPAVFGGITPYDAMHDAEAAGKAWIDFNLEFQPDSSVSPVLYTTPSSVFEALDYRLYSWPGHGVAKEASFQYNEKEWMHPEEYDHLIDDPTDFLLRVYLPRAVGAFAGFGTITSLLDYTELPFVSGNVGAWTSPDMIDGLERILRAAKDTAAWADTTFAKVAQLISMGFPAYFGGGCKAPYDILGDTLRGMRGVVVDLYRYPDKVQAACERLVPVALKWALDRPPLTTPIVFLPLHKGADGFMSDEQFKTFYWPSLRAVLLGLIEEGIIPFLFAEGRYGSRLETIMDLPKGKTIWLFDQTDMARAKETIGQVACIQGNVPLSLLHAGTIEQVVDYTKKVIDDAAKGGGYILDMGAVADDGKPENLHAMIKTAKEYGVY